MASIQIRIQRLAVHIAHDYLKFRGFHARRGACVIISREVKEMFPFLPDSIPNNALRLDEEPGALHLNLRFSDEERDR